MLNHVATATTSKVARIYNMSELFERKREWHPMPGRRLLGNAK